MCDAFALQWSLLGAMLIGIIYGAVFFV